ncbi:MAG: hypothetical protein EBE86_012825 [Hormoscilla sp. GUM202]|nr:hypothetical protein [Hormoscilla sp. GUM202]
MKYLVYREGNELLDVTTAISEPERPEGEIIFQGKKRIYRTAKMISSGAISACDRELARVSSCYEICK